MRTHPNEHTAYEAIYLCAQGVETMATALYLALHECKHDAIVDNSPTVRYLLSKMEDILPMMVQEARTAKDSVEWLVRRGGVEKPVDIR